MGRTHNKSVSGGGRRTKRQPFRPTCWTQYIREQNQEKGILLHGLQSIPRKVLSQRDIQSRYTVLHALCSSDLETDVIRRRFEELNQLMLMVKVVAKDGDGDMPLQSAVRSGASVETVELILNYVPGSKEKMLGNKNRFKETALELSLRLKTTDVFELLLEECIKKEILPELTGIGRATQCSNTVVHKCISKRRITFLRAYLEVCQKCGVKPALCIVNEEGYTPWLDLLSYDERPLVEEVFDLLQQYNICLSSLYIDKRNRETMLHKAYRNGNQMLIDLITKNDPTALEKLDRHKRKPQQRNRKLVGADPLTPTPHERSEAVENAQQSQHKRRRRRPQPVSDAVPPASNIAPAMQSTAGLVSNAAPSAAPTPVRPSKQQRKPEQRVPDSKNVPSCDEVPAVVPTHHTSSPTLKEDSSHHISTSSSVKASRRDSDELTPVHSVKESFVENSMLETRPHSLNPQWVHGKLPAPKQPDLKPSEHCPPSDDDEVMTSHSLKSHAFHHHPT